MKQIRVLLADDHAILREGIEVLINEQPDMEVIGHAADGREAVRQAQALTPDVIVLDLSMPLLAGPEAAEQILAQSPGARIIALTRHSDQGYLRRLLQAGAVGYVLKQSAADALISAIRTVAGGGMYIEPGLSGSLLQRAYARSPDLQWGRRETLTPREEEVLRLIAWGHSNKAVAAELGISIKTVESYKATATDKLKLHSRADIVQYAVKRGWLYHEHLPK